VPVEGQQKTPVRPRDLWFLAALATAAVVAVAVGAYLHFTRASSSEAGCVTVTLASTMGGATIHKCGAAAVRFCREQGSGNPEIAAACRRAGY
jgi:hypothetical protein